MIVVIADDLTGAAEIAGVGWRHGLRAEILHRDQAPSRAALVVYDSDSRNCTGREAARRVARIAHRLQAARPAWIFKKTDSLLRGSVLAEIESVLRVFGLPRCLLAPANPAAGRTIREGKYFVRGVPLSETDFRNDPRHPRLTARVTALLGASHRQTVIVLRRPIVTLPVGVVVGEASSAEQVECWAAALGNDTLPAGGVDFFTAILQARGFRPAKRQPRPSFGGAGAVLFASGSLAASSFDFLQHLRVAGSPVLPLPRSLLGDCDRNHIASREWEAQLTAALRTHTRVAMNIGVTERLDSPAGERLGRLLIATAARIVTRARPRCVCVEGGATAALLLEQLGLRRLVVAAEFATGVTGVRPVGRRGPFLVFKPGSYAWPACFKP